MRKKMIQALIMEICGILFLLSAVLEEDRLADRTEGILFGVGSMLCALGIVRFLLCRFEARHPREYKLNEIEAKDERNVAIRRRAQAGAGIALQWAVMGAAWVSILADGPLWLTILAVGAFCGKALLEFALIQYYCRRM